MTKHGVASIKDPFLKNPRPRSNASARASLCRTRFVTQDAPPVECPKGMSNVMSSMSIDYIVYCEPWAEFSILIGLDRGW
jgi:hypothetical protein